MLSCQTTRILAQSEQVILQTRWGFVLKELLLYRYKDELFLLEVNSTSALEIAASCAFVHTHSLDAILHRILSVFEKKIIFLKFIFDYKKMLLLCGMTLWVRFPRQTWRRWTCSYILLFYYHNPFCFIFHRFYYLYQLDLYTTLCIFFQVKIILFLFQFSYTNQQFGPDCDHPRLNEVNHHVDAHLLFAARW